MLDPLVNFIVALTALATATTTLAVALTALIGVLRNRQRITRVHKEVNGRMDQLIDVRTQLAYREGWEHGQVDPAAPPPDPDQRGRGGPSKSDNP